MFKTPTNSIARFVYPQHANQISCLSNVFEIIRTALQFKETNVKLRHFLEQKALFIVASILMMFSQTLNLKAQTPVWMLGQQGAEFTPTSINNVTLNNIYNGFQFAPSGFNSAIDPSNQVAFYVDGGIVYYPDGLALGAINVNFSSPNPIFGMPNIPGVSNLEGTPEIIIVPVPGRCQQYYIIGCYSTYRTGNIITNTGTDPAVVYATVNMAMFNTATNRFGVFWNAVTQQPTLTSSVFGNTINPEAGVIWENYNVHTSDMHIGVTKLRRDNTRFLFISRGGHLYKVDVTSNGIVDLIEVNYTSPTPNSQSGTSIAELEIWEIPSLTPETEDSRYRLAFPEGNSNNLVLTTVDPLGTTTNQTVSTFLTSNGSYSNIIRGIEFSPNGNYVYATVDDGGTNLRCYNSTTLANVPLSNITLSTLDPYHTSMIESGANSNLYVMSVDGQSLGEISDPNNPPNATFVTNAITVSLPYTLTNGISGNFQSVFRNNWTATELSVLPDQIDYEDYSLNFPLKDESCCNFNSRFDV